MSQPQSSSMVLNRPPQPAANGTLMTRGMVPPGATQQTLQAQPIVVSQTTVPRMQQQQNHLRPTVSAAGQVVPSAAAAMSGSRTIIINNPAGNHIQVPLTTLQSLQPGQGIPAGENNLLVKTVNGQYQILKVGQSGAASSAVNSIVSTAAAASLPTRPVAPGTVIRGAMATAATAGPPTQALPLPSPRV